MKWQKKMMKVSDVKEAVILTKSLEIMLQKLIRESNLYDDKKLYADLFNAIDALRMKYHKIAMTRMRKNEKGEFEFLNAN